VPPPAPASRGDVSDIERPYRSGRPACIASPSEEYSCSADSVEVGFVVVAVVVVVSG